MAQLVKPRCRFKCRFIQITDTLWLCPHSAFGSSSDRMGAVAEARRLLERQGGYDVILSRIVEAEEERKLDQRIDRERAQEKADRDLKYDAAS